MRCFDCGAKVGGMFGRKGCELENIIEIAFCDQCLIKDKNRRIVATFRKTGRFPDEIWIKWIKLGMEGKEKK
jgi:hypothetical protein